MSDLRRSVPPLVQEQLLKYLEQHPDLALAAPRSRMEQIQTRKLWDKVAKTLNTVDEKVVKNGRGWCRYWADLKYKTRRKYATATNKRNLRMFTQSERRVIKLLTDEHGILLPNARQLADKEFQDIAKPRTKRNIVRSDSDNTQDTNQESNTQTHEHTDQIYIINHIEHTDDHKMLINGENSNTILNVRSSREMYSTEKHNNSMEDQYNTMADLNVSTEVKDNAKIRHYNTLEHNMYNAAEHMYSTAEHNSIEYHNNITTEHNMYNTTESRTKKTIEELKKEILEFQLKRQKELFEREKRERYERHNLEMDILRLKRDILVKELNNLK